jgi:hypothetical protein
MIRTLSRPPPKPSKRSSCVVPSPREGANREPGRTHDLPSPYLLKVHAALCRVLHLSGAAEYIAQVISEGHVRIWGRGEVISADGSTDLEAYFIGRGLISVEN